MRWHKAKKYAGIRYREHATRRHANKPDRYYTIYFRIDGDLHEEGLGWASQGWTVEKANFQRSQLKEAHRTGQGAKTLREKRAHDKAKREAGRRSGLTFRELFTKHYFPEQTHKVSARREEALFRHWIEPVLGSRKLTDIVPLHIERVARNVTKAGLSPRTAAYCIAVTRQVFNFARRNKLFVGEIPTSGVRKPKVDNKRMRFLTHDEADRLLQSLAEKDSCVHDQALLSLHTGMRLGEIFNLTWQDVDLAQGMLTLRDTKNNQTRHAYLTHRVAEMLAQMHEDATCEWVFPDRNGNKARWLSKAFDRSIAEIGFNDDVTDPRYRVSFHTLRHTFASRLVQSGVDLYRVQKLLGHKTAVMTQRYAHLAAEDLRDAVRVMEKSLKKKRRDVVKVNRIGE